MNEFSPIGEAAARVVAGLSRIERYPVGSRGGWLAMRKRDVTASEMGALLGVDPNKGARTVYADKNGDGVDRGDNATMRAGRLLEPGVAIAVGEERPTWKITPAKEYVRDADARIGATPDFYVDDPARGFGVLETKTVRPQVFEKDWSGGAPPLKFILQTLTQMMLTGATWGAIGCLIRTAGDDYPIYVYDVPRHPVVEATIRRKVAAFWEAFDAGNPPPADYAKDADVISAAFPREKGESIDLSGSNRLPGILERRAELTAAIKVAEDEKAAIDAEIKDAMGVAPEGRLPGWRISWKSQKKKDFAALIEKLEIDDASIPRMSHRVMRITDLRAKGA